MDKPYLKKSTKAKQATANQAPVAETTGGLSRAAEIISVDVASQASQASAATGGLALASGAGRGEVVGSGAAMPCEDLAPSSSAGNIRGHRVRRVSSDDSYFGGVYLPDPHLKGMEGALESPGGSRAPSPITEAGYTSDASWSSRATGRGTKRRRPQTHEDDGRRGRPRGRLSGVLSRRKSEAFFVHLTSDDESMERILHGTAARYAGKPVAKVSGDIAEALVEVVHVARNSANLKGTFVKRLKDAAKKIGRATAELGHRACAIPGSGMSEEEAARLRRQCELHELRAAELEKELEEARRPGLTRSPRLAADGEFSGEGSILLREMEVLMDRKLAILKDEILREVGGTLVRDLPLAPVASKEAGAVVQKITSGAAPPAVRATGAEATMLAPAKGGRGKADMGFPTVPPEVVTPLKRGGKKKKERAEIAPAASSGVGVSGARGPPATREAVHAEEVVPWSRVVGRRANPEEPSALGFRRREGSKRPAPAEETLKKHRVGKAPSTAAVLLTVDRGGSYAEAMTLARSKIDLKEMGIDALRPKRAVTGGLLLEIGGAGCAARADRLAEQLREVFSGGGVGVSRPVKRTELRVAGLDDSVAAREVRDSVVAVGGCSEGDVVVGEIRRSPDGLGSCWVRCPRAAAIRVEKAGRLAVGWSSARVTVLPPRPLQCYRCLAFGHVGARCTVGADGCGACFRCGGSGHRAAECRADAPRCPVCAGEGRPAEHRMGARCAPPPIRGRRFGGAGPSEVVAISGGGATPTPSVAGVGGAAPSLGVAPGRGGTPKSASPAVAGSGQGPVARPTAVGQRETGRACTPSRGGAPALGGAARVRPVIRETAGEAARVAPWGVQGGSRSSTGGNSPEDSGEEVSLLLSGDEAGEC